MRFTRFKGPVKLGENLQADAIYPARLPLEDAGVLSGPENGFQITNDVGTAMNIMNDTRFDFPATVYAAVSKAFDGKQVGDVVRLDGAFSEDMYQVVADAEHHTESGMVHRTNFIVLDHTNVGLGTEVLMRLSPTLFLCLWMPILAISGDMCVRLSKSGDFKELTNYRLPVSGGDVLTRPIVTCVEPVPNELTEGAHYYLMRHDYRAGGTESVYVVNDKGSLRWYKTAHFSGLFLPGK